MSTQLQTQALFENSSDTSDAIPEQNHNAMPRSQSQFGPTIAMMFTTFIVAFAGMYFYPTWSDNHSPQSQAKQVDNWERAMKWLGIDTDPKREHKQFLRDMKFEMERSVKEQQRRAWSD